MKSSNGKSRAAVRKRNGKVESNLEKSKASVGRPIVLDAERRDRLLEAYYSHPYSFRELADMFGVSRMTVWRAVQEPAAMPQG